MHSWKSVQEYRKMDKTKSMLVRKLDKQAVSGGVGIIPSDKTWTSTSENTHTHTQRLGSGTGHSTFTVLCCTRRHAETIMVVSLTNSWMNLSHKYSREYVWSRARKLSRLICLTGAREGNKPVLCYWPIYTIQAADICTNTVFPKRSSCKLPLVCLVWHV